MDYIALESFAKINLSLDVLHKRDDGYHEISTIMQQIDLKDRVILKDKEKGIEIQCNKEGVPLDESNTVYKAWEKIVEKTGVNRGVHIIIEKNIPVASGLAGGSSNGAAVLRGLNQLWGLNLSEEELFQIGKEIGADVPFCLMGGTAWATGIGEKLTRLKDFSNKLIIVANISVPVSTAYVYNNLNLDKKNSRLDMEKIIQYMEEDNLVKLGENMFNVMEEVVIREYPIIDAIKKDMVRLGALGSLMTGSGPTVFGLFDDEGKLQMCKGELEKKVKNVFIARTL